MQYETTIDMGRFGTYDICKIVAGGGYSSRGIMIFDSDNITKYFIRTGKWTNYVASEVAILRNLDHINIQKLCMGIVNVEDHQCSLIFEGAVSDLDQIDFATMKGLKTCVMRDIIPGVQYLHSAGYIHMDIKCSNIVMGNNGICKLIDFNLAMPIGTICTRQVGTVKYMAPEIVAAQKKPVIVSPQQDYYSLGVTIRSLRHVGHRIQRLRDFSNPDWSFLCKLIGELTAFFPQNRCLNI